jgi:transposase-like protein
MLVLAGVPVELDTTLARPLYVCLALLTALVQTRGVAVDDEEMQRFVPIEGLFRGRHFDRQIIIWYVSRYTSFKLSLRDLVVMMADRGISVTHTTILRWVQRYLPEFERRWCRYARRVGGSWRMDETYIKVHGQWVYLYRAVDKAGQTVDFFLSRNRAPKR